MLFICSVLCYFSQYYAAATESISCGIPSTGKNEIKDKIIGGSSTAQRKWPWNVRLGYRLNGGGYYVFCGGTLIDHDWFVTAAHCVYDVENKAQKDHSNSFVVLGDIEVPQGSVHKYLPRQQIIVHDSFEGVGKNDIALVHLFKSVNYTDYIRPVCLPEYGQDYVGKVGTLATITGWGNVAPAKNLKPTKLQVATVEVYSGWKCAAKFAAKLCFWCASVMLQDTICAGHIDGEVDSCQGDSGSPMVVKSADGAWTLVGVVSGGVLCGKKGMPSLYTYVPKYIRWMNKIMKLYTYARW